jgi:hypothetical protein
MIQRIVQLALDREEPTLISVPINPLLNPYEIALEGV